MTIVPPGEFLRFVDWRNMMMMMMIIIMILIIIVVVVVVVVVVVIITAVVPKMFPWKLDRTSICSRKVGWLNTN